MIDNFSDYKKIAHDFKLGILTTEQGHPFTEKLSTVLEDSTHDAIKILKRKNQEAAAVRIQRTKQRYLNYKSHC